MAPAEQIAALADVVRAFGFDDNGDTTQTPVTVVRVRRQGRSIVVGSVEGGVVDRVVRPSPRLVAPEE